MLPPVDTLFCNMREESFFSAQHSVPSKESLAVTVDTAEQAVLFWQAVGSFLYAFHFCFIYLYPTHLPQAGSGQHTTQKK